MYDRSKVQWTLTVTIYHGPSFGHVLEMATETKGRPDRMTHDTIGSWKGIGVPEPVMTQALAVVNAAIQEHLVSRYGVQELLPAWPDEVDPF